MNSSFLKYEFLKTNHMEMFNKMNSKYRLHYNYNYSKKRNSIAGLILFSVGLGLSFTQVTQAKAEVMSSDSESSSESSSAVTQVLHNKEVALKASTTSVTQAKAEATATTPKSSATDSQVSSTSAQQPTIAVQDDQSSANTSSDKPSTTVAATSKSKLLNTTTPVITKSTNVDASESSGTSENTTSSTNNTASSGDDDQSVDMNGIHHYIPLHPERGADPSDNRWGALMKYWDTWYGVGYQVSDSKPASGGPGSPIWPGSGSTAVWPVGSDYASMNRFITRTIEYRDKSTGELITGVTPVVQKVHYGVAFVMDLVTGEILGYMTPNTNGTFPDKPTIQHRADAWYVIGNSNFTAVTSPDLSSKGYLAPDLATVAQQKVNPGDQDDTVNVYYDHAVVPVNPTNPQTPGTPINPDDPDSPKWPVGTDKDSLTTDIHQTIHYQYGDGSQAAPDKTDSTTFEHQVEIDKVTGEVVKDDGWTAKNGKTSFDSKTSPVIPGYTASKPASDPVDGLTQDSKDDVQTIVYTKNPVAGGNVTAKYVDENGNPIADDVVASGNVGDPYSTTQKDIPGYTLKEVQGNPTGSFTDQDQTVTYVYTKNPATDNNGGTGSDQPGNPNSSQPGNPFQPSNATNNGVINTSTNTGSKVNNGAVNSPKLPQTGENNSQNQTMSFIGILLVTFASLLGFLGIKKRRHD